MDPFSQSWQPKMAYVGIVIKTPRLCTYARERAEHMSVRSPPGTPPDENLQPTIDAGLTHLHPGALQDNSDALLATVCAGSD